LDLREQGQSLLFELKDNERVVKEGNETTQLKAQVNGLKIEREKMIKASVELKNEIDRLNENKNNF